jgi:hypothetical protein
MSVQCNRLAIQTPTTVTPRDIIKGDFRSNINWGIAWWSPWVRMPIVCHIILNCNRLSLVGKITWKALCAYFAPQNFRHIIFDKKSVNCASKYCLYFSSNANMPAPAQCKATLSPATRHCDRGFETQSVHDACPNFLCLCCPVQRPSEGLCLCPRSTI